MTFVCHCGSRCSGRRGLILLEVVIALALFVMAVVLTGSAIRSSLAASGRMAQRTRALALAQSLLAQVRSNCITVTDTAEGTFAPQFPNIVYTIQAVQDTTRPTLRYLTVTVAWEATPGLGQTADGTDRVSLTGWEYRPPEPDESADSSAVAGGAP